MQETGDPTILPMSKDSHKILSLSTGFSRRLCSTAVTAACIQSRKRTFFAVADIFGAMEPKSTSSNLARARTKSAWTLTLSNESGLIPQLFQSPSEPSSSSLEM